MSHSNSKSYLEISDDAMRELKTLLEASLHNDPVVVFFMSDSRLDALELQPGKVTEDDMIKVREFIYSPDFLERSTVLIETTPRSKFAEHDVVEIGGIPVNAPRLPTDESVTPEVRLTYSEGAFHLVATRAAV